MAIDKKDEKKPVVTEIRPSAPRASDVEVKKAVAPIEPPKAPEPPPIPEALVADILALPEDMSLALQVKDYVRWIDLRRQLRESPSREALETFLSLPKELSHHACYPKWLALRGDVRAFLG